MSQLGTSSTQETDDWIKYWIKSLLNISIDVTVTFKPNEAILWVKNSINVVPFSNVKVKPTQ